MAAIGENWRKKKSLQTKRFAKSLYKLRVLYVLQQVGYWDCMLCANLLVQSTIISSFLCIFGENKVNTAII